MSKLDELIAELCPNGVEYKILGDVVEMKRGTSLTKDKAIPGEIPVISGGHEPAFYCDTSNRDGETITVAGSGAGAGYVQYWTEPIFVNDAFSVKGKECLRTKYAYYFLTNIQQQIYDTKKGGGVPHVHISDIENFVVPVPPLEVQEEIVRILDAFSELQAELQAELQIRKEQWRYYRDQSFIFDKGTKWIKIGDLTTVFSSARVHKDEWTNSGVPFYRSSDVISYFKGVENSRGKAFISYELFEKLTKNSLKISKGDILVTGGGTIGIPYLVPNDNPLHVKDGDLICIKKSDNILPEFLYYYFLSSNFRRYLENITHDATIAHYTISQIEDTIVPVPPLPEQQRIVSILERFDVLCNDITHGLPAEIEARRKQYEYYRDRLLTFSQKGALVV